MEKYIFLILSLLLIISQTVYAQGNMCVNIAPPIQNEKVQIHPLLKKVEEQLGRGCHPGDENTYPLADLASLRHPNEVVLLSDLELKLFIAASLSQDPKKAHEILNPLLNHRASSEIRFLAAAVVAMVISKSNIPEYLTLFTKMISIMEVSNTDNDHMKADIDYFKGLRYEAISEEDNAIKAFDKAISNDKQYFNAIVHAILLQINRINGIQSNSQALCADEYYKLLDYAGILMDIDACPLQAAHTSIWLRRRFAYPDNYAAIHAIEVYLSIISRRPEAADAALTAFNEMESCPCRKEISTFLAELVKKLHLN